MSDKCLVIPTKTLLKKNFLGYVPSNYFDYLSIINKKEHQRFLLRKTTSQEQKLPVEEDPSYKQPVVYSIVTNNGKILVYQRADANTIGEQRLALKYSLGIGGHIDPTDDKLNLITSSLERELNEELSYKGKKTIKHVGYINLDHNMVNKVHFGLVFITDLEDSKLKLEKELLHGSFKTISEIKNKEIYEKLEEWSKVLIDNIHTIL